MRSLGWSLLWLACSAAARGAVPPPTETPAAIVVSGRTSTAQDVKVVKVGQEVPVTHGGDAWRPTAGYEFFVSQHYALKSNLGDEPSRQVLEWAELALPHWRALTGLGPPDAGSRMALVCATDERELLRALQDDLGAGQVVAPGGGFTIDRTRVAYTAPGPRPTARAREIVIHETLHLLLAAALGDAGGDALTYAAAAHVYDPAKKQLTVECLDRATLPNPLDDCLADWQRQPPALRDLVVDQWSWGQGYAALTLYHQFFWTDPDRSAKWRVWRDEYLAGRVSRETNAATMAGIFGPVDGLDAAWTDWLRARHQSFRVAAGRWEQDGDTLWVAATPADARRFAQLDLRYAPAEPPRPDPLRMDYPAEPLPPTVGPVRRGVPEPSVGCVVAAVGGNAAAGLGLGVEGESMCRVLVAQDKLLVVDGVALGMQRAEVPLTDEVRAGAAQDGGRYGVTVTIAPAALAIVLRAGPANAVREMTASVPLDAVQRGRLLAKPLAVIGRDGAPRITPWIDDGRAPVDLARPAAANRWRDDGFERLTALTKAAWRLGAAAPPALLDLRATLLAACAAGATEREAAARAYEERIGAVVAEIRGAAAEPATRDLAIVDLAGLLLLVDAAWPMDVPEQVMATARVVARQAEPLTCAVAFAGGQPAAAPVPVTPDRPLVVTLPCQVARDTAAVTATFTLDWRGERVTVALRREILDTSIPAWSVIGPFPNAGGPTVDVPHAIETGAIAADAVHSVPGGDVAWRTLSRPAELPVLSDFAVDFAGLAGAQTDAKAYALVRIDSPLAQDAILSLGSDDGAVAWLNGRLVHRNLAVRGYVPRSDRVPIRLQRGANVLLVKVTQGTGPWLFGARLTDPTGKPLRGVRTTVERPGAG